MFRKFKRKSLKAIYCLQETHSTDRSQSEFDLYFDSHNLYYSHGSSNSNGVLTAIPKSLDIDVVRKIEDDDGRFLILDIKYNDEIFTIGNIYAPTRNFEEAQITTLRKFIFQLFNETQSTNFILCGDWNLYLSLLLDKLDSMPERNDNPSYRDELKSFLEVNNLVDVWRILNPYKRVFTWHRGEKRSRLDYFFVSEHLLNRLDDVKIHPGVQSDHSLLEIKLDPAGEDPRGRGFWKFPENLLHDTEYVSKIKELINNKIMEHQIDDLGLKWDLIKMEIRNFTVPYCSHMKKEKLKHEKQLNERYSELFSIINTNEQIPESTLNEYYRVKRELEMLEKEHARGIIVRSKVQFVEEGEKCTSYFLRQEKNNYENKHITKLKDTSNENQYVENPREILDMEKRFYENLYSEKSDPTQSREAEDKIFRGLQIPKVKEADKIACEEELSESEILKSVKAMKNGKSPGTCGLTTEFYKFFWIDIKDLLIASINYNLNRGMLSLEQRRGILTLIPKKDKDRLYLKNWRPLTLLNTDYKIIAKALSNRLTKILPFIIEDDQTGYVSGRFIGCNIRLIEDILSQTTKLNIAGILLTIDFEKAFDSIRWKFIWKTLKNFNFGDRFISYVSTLYNQISTTVINNGHISNWFTPKRGVRQGCPLSPYLFILAVEVLALSIRQNKDISGLVFNGVEVKLSQLADDTNCVVKDEQSLKNILDTFSLFRSGTGLDINVDKTTARCLGNFIPSNHKLFGLKWTQEPVHTLGVNLSGREEDHYNLNFRPKIYKMKQLLNSWKCRKLSLKGKITVINSLAISKLVYLANTILTPEKVYREVKALILDFLWDGSTPKIAYSTLIQGIEKGGLKLVDLELKVKSLCITWVKRLTNQSKGKWKALPSVFYNTTNLNTYFSTNSSRLTWLNGPQFYKVIQNIWSDITRVVEPNEEIIQSQTLWNNRYITIQNTPFLWKKWKDAGIFKIRDIIDNNGTFLDSEQIYQQFGIRVNFLEVLQIRKSLPYEWRRIIERTSNLSDMNEPCFSYKGKVIQISKANSKTAYLYFRESINKVPTCIRKWIEYFPHLDEKAQRDNFTRTFLMTKETKLQSFQYKILHRYIHCRKKLHEMTIIDSPNCEHCGTLDTIIHFFVECDYVVQFWSHLQNWINTVYSERIAFHYTEQNILFGINDATEFSKVVNYISLIAKYFIYTNRLKSNHVLDMRTFFSILKYKLRIEKNISTKNKSTHFDKFIRTFEAIPM